VSCVHQGNLLFLPYFSNKTTLVAKRRFYNINLITLFHNLTGTPLQNEVMWLNVYGASVATEVILFDGMRWK